MATFSALALVVVGIIVTAECTPRNVEIFNNCNNPIWVGAQGSPLPFNGGFQLNANQRQSFSIPGYTQAGRIWARTGCTYQNGHFVCDTGDCGSAANNFGVQCQGIGGQPPATLAEFTFQEQSAATPNPQDYYDISNVDGYNVGIKIEALNGQQVNGVDAKYNCGNPSCSFDTSKCPAELKMTDANGRVVCASICAAINSAVQRSKFAVLQNIFNNRDQRNSVCCACDCGPGCGCASPSSQKCCSPYNLPSPNEQGGKCRVEQWPLASNGQMYNQVFKSQCPDAYAWQFDDSKSTYLCKNANYRITFCP